MEDVNVLHAVAAGLALDIIRECGPLTFVDSKSSVGMSGDRKMPMGMLGDRKTPMAMLGDRTRPMAMIRDQEVPMLAAPRRNVTVKEMPPPMMHLPWLPQPSPAVSCNPQIERPYASTYQVAHCGANACSPAACISEFPPQRLNPSPTEGNFEVGFPPATVVMENDINRCLSPTRNSDNLRHAIRPQLDRDVDVFVSSLRKYPNADIIPSSELIEKLLKTHSCFPRSVVGQGVIGSTDEVTGVYVPNLISVPKDSPIELCKTLKDKPTAKEQKSPQAHKRGKKEEVKRRLVLKKPGKIQFNVKPTKMPAEKSPAHSPDRLSSFDYLNSGAPCSPVTEKPNRRQRTLENVFRDLYPEERGLMAFPVCSAMQSRYERHVRKCHPTSSQVAHIDLSKMKACSRCSNKRPCPCDAIKRFCFGDKEEENKRALEDAIFSWLNEIPVYPNEKPHDKYIRDAIVKKLAETLNGIKEDEISTQGEEEIRKAIDKLPMWYPKDERDRDNFKNDITDSLLNKIKPIKSRKKTKQAAADFIDTLNFDNGKDVDREQIVNGITEELNKLALNRPDDDEVYRDMVKMKAFEMLDRLPIKTRGNRYEYLKNMADDLADRVMNIDEEDKYKLQGTIDQETKRMIKDEITEVLDSSNATIKDREKVEEQLHKAVTDIAVKNMDKSKAMNIIRNILKGKVPDDKIEGIAEQVLSTADQVKPSQATTIDPVTKQIIKEDISDILDSSNVKVKNREKVEENLQRAIDDIITKDMDHDKAVEHIKSVLKGKVPSDKIEEIAEQVLTLAEQMRPDESITIDQETKKTIMEDISNILDFSDAQIKDRGKVEEGLQKSVADIISKGMDSDQAIRHIKTVLKGKVPSDKIEDIAEKVLAMADQVRPVKAKTIDSATKQMIKEDIREILDSSDVNVKNRGQVEESLQKSVADIISKGMNNDQAIKHIKTVLKGKVPADKIEDIAEQVLTLADQIRPDEPITIDQETKKTIKEDIRNILDFSDAQIKNRGKVEEGLQKSVADIISKAMDSDQAIKHIKTVLKGKVPSDKIEDIAEKVLAMADQVRPTKAKTIDPVTKQMIKEDISEILDLSDVNVKNRAKVEESLQKSVADIISKGMDNDQAIKHIKTVLKGKVPADKIEDIAEQVLTLADQIRPDEPIAIDQETKKTIKEDIRNILDFSDAQIKNRGKVEEGLQKSVADIISKGMDSDQAIRHIKTVLKGKVPSDKIEDIAEKVLAMADQVRPVKAKTIDSATKQMIKEDIREILDSSDVNVKNRGKVEESLQKSVADIISKGMNNDQALKHIKTVLKGKVPADKIDDIAEQVLNLADQVTPTEAKTIDSVTKQMIKEDISDILDSSAVNVKNREKVEESLQNSVADIISKGMNNDQALKHIKTVLKGKVPADKIEDIAEQVLTMADQVRPDKAKTIDPVTRQMIKEDISDILDLSDINVKNRGKVEESLQKSVADIISKGMDSEQAIKHIKTVLKGKVPSDKIEDIAEKVLAMADQIRPTEAKAIDPVTKQMIKEDISEILDLSDVNVKNRPKIEESLQKSVADIISKGMDSDQAIKHIKTVLKGKVPADKIDDIAEKVLNMAEQVRPTKAKTINSATKKMIKEDISDILDSSDVKVKNRGKIEESLQKSVADIISKGMNNDQALKHIKTVLKGKVPADKIDDIAEQVLTMADQIRPTEATTIDPVTKQMIKEDISEILDLSDVNVKNRPKVEESLQKSVADIISKGMDSDQAIIHIKTVLKGKVPADKIDDIAEKVLNMAEQVRPTKAKTIDPVTKKVIKEDISDILDSSDVNVKNRGKIEESLQKSVADIISKGMNNDQALKHIKTVLKGKVPADKIDDIAEQVLTMADQIRPTEATTIDPVTKQMIKEDISEILDLSDVNVKNRPKVEESLQKSVADIISKGMDSDQAIKHIKTVLKGKVPADKIDDIAEKVLNMAEQVRPTKAKAIDPVTKQMIKEDISEILDSSDVNVKNRGKVEENLQKAIADIITKDMDQDKAVEHIKSVLKGKVPSDKIEEIAEQVLTLADKARPDQSKTIDQETNQIIKDDISNLLDSTDAHIKNRGKVEDSLRKAVVNIVTKNMDKDKAITHIKNALKGQVSDDKIDDIAKQVLNLADEVKPAELTKVDKETKRIIKEDISDILDVSNAHIKNRGKVEQSLQKAVADIAAKGLSKDKAISHIKSILKGKVPEETADDIAQQVLKLADEVKPHITGDISDISTIKDKDVSKIALAMAEGNKSMFDASLQQSISNILDHTNGHITNRSKVEESLRDILNDLVMRGMDKREAQNQIHRILKGNVPDSEAANISKQILGLADQISTISNDYGGGPSASSTQNAETMYLKQVNETIREWLNKIVKLNERDSKKVIEAIANDVVDRQKYLQLNPEIKTSEEKECEILREQVYKALYKLIDNKSVLSVMSEVENLMRSLNTIPKIGTGGLVQDSKEFIQENFEGALLDWLRGSPIYQYRNPRNRQAQEQMMSNLAATLTTVLSSQMKDKPSAKTDEVLLKEITKQLEVLPLEPQFKSKEYIRMLASHMLDYLKSLQLFQDISLRTGINDTLLMPLTNHLHDVVKDWCEKLPLPDTDGGYELKQDLANKIILKIGELNMNQDIFNDDLLYEEMLQEFIDEQVKALRIDLNVPEASQELIDEIMKVKQKVQDNLIGRAYKQQLRDAVSDTLPSIVCPTEEDIASLELMKENLVDAFINLHYSGEDEAVKAKLKRKITDEVNKFVNDYLGCCPAPPISARKLNDNLYKALMSVPVPPDEDSMRSEVEAVRLKDVINNWLKILSLGKQTKAEQLHTNKIVTLMCQKLQELESEFNPDFEDIAKEEIKKYLMKLPIKNKNNIDRMAKVLVDKIISTSESRSLIERPSTALEDDICLRKIKCLPHQRHCTGMSSRASYLNCNSPVLSCDTCKKTKKVVLKTRSHERSTQSTKCCCNDAALDPPPSDNMSQTNLRLASKSCQCNKSAPVVPKSTCPKTVLIVNAPPTESVGHQVDLCPYARKGYHSDCIYGDRKDAANQTLAPGSIRRCPPPPLIPSRGICPSHNYTSTIPEYCGMPRRIQRPRSCRPTFSPRVTPKRQVLSACPNEYIRRPKPHNCERSSHVSPNCSRKPPCQVCRQPSYHKCYRLNVPCPHPSCLYFK